MFYDIRMNRLLERQDGTTCQLKSGQGWLVSQQNTPNTQNMHKKSTILLYKLCSQSFSPFRYILFFFYFIFSKIKGKTAKRQKARFKTFSNIFCGKIFFFQIRKI